MDTLEVKKDIIIMDTLEVPEHEHPLKLVDLQLQCEEEEEEEEEEEGDDDEGGDPITKVCGRCDQEIHMYHRYYYKCTICSSCDFSLHKFCAELSTRLEHTLHRDPLIQQWLDCGYTCAICRSMHSKGEVCYCCFDCHFYIDVKCVVEVRKKIIHHPCHPHLLNCYISKPILCDCNACGKRHEGMFYECTTCAGFTIHSECAFLPETLLIQQRTHGAFYHTHPLTISYSFPKMDQSAKYNPSCRVCGHDFYDTSDLWIYKCDKCMYYVHVDCATSRREPFMSIFMSAGISKTIKNYKDADHPHLLHLPFPDETYSVPKCLFSQESGTSGYEVNLNHTSHQHALILVDQTQTNTNEQTINSWLLMCHNPMKKIQLLCNGCMRPIVATMPFYTCAQLSCKFFLHEWCTRLPQEIENHPGHPQHTLHLMYSNVLPLFFCCDVCDLLCNGFAYCCVECKYYVDVTCGLIPKEITHESHPNHILSMVRMRSRYDRCCHMCGQYPRRSQLSFCCKSCDILIHPECALLLPEAIRHKYDKHPMHLSYLPIENHKSRYFCEICEEEMNPHRSFYHCQDCVQSVHTACAPLILQSETVTYGCYWRSMYYFINIMFGGIHNTNGHPHPLSFVQGIASDGQCSMCRQGLRYKMIFKCLECKFAVDYDCFQRFYKI